KGAPNGPKRQSNPSDVETASVATPEDAERKPGGSAALCGERVTGSCCLFLRGRSLREGVDHDGVFLEQWDQHAPATTIEADIRWSIETADFFAELFTRFACVHGSVGPR